MPRTRFRNLGSTALHLTYVAKGSLTGAIVSSPKLWDIAAGTIIAEGAGAIVTNWAGEKIFPVDLNVYEGEKLQVIAANKKVHAELVDIMKAQ